MKNKLLLLGLFTALITNISGVDFKLLDQSRQDDQFDITVQSIKKSRYEKRQERLLNKRQKRLARRLNRIAEKQKGLIVKSIREQNVEELKHNLDIYLKYQNEELSIKYLEALIALITDFVEMRDLRLQLADLYFKNERYDKAGSVYTEYYEAYPGYISAEYALSQAIISKYKQTRDCDQDTSVTREVIDLSKQYLQNKSYFKYRKQIQELSIVCSSQIFESEVQVFEHYFKNGYLKSAQRRIDYMKEKILPKQLELKSRVDDLQELVNQAQAGKNPLKLLKAYHRLPVKKESKLENAINS